MSNSRHLFLKIPNCWLQLKWNQMFVFWLKKKKIAIWQTRLCELSKGKFLNLEHCLATVYSLFPGRVLEKGFELRPASCSRSHEAALIVACQPQVPRRRPLWAPVFETEACVSMPQMRMDWASLEGHRSLGFSLGFTCAGKASGPPETWGSMCCILCPSFLPCFNHNGALSDVGGGWGQISAKKVYNHFSIICEVVKKSLKCFLHWILEHFKYNKGIFLITKSSLWLVSASAWVGHICLFAKNRVRSFLPCSRWLIAYITRISSRY